MGLTALKGGVIMLEKVIESIEKRLKERGVSLIMMFDDKGKILWHRGREIRGRSIEEGSGFSKKACEKILKSGEAVIEKDSIISIAGDGLSDTAVSKKIRSIVILPLDDNRYFYVDGMEKEFDEEAIVTIKEGCYYLRECIVESERYYRDKISRLETIDDKIKDKIVKYATRTDEPVLITGETGCGKGYIAELIHELSGRLGKFIHVNVTTIPESLFESELFGYRKGAFTGANGDKVGYIEEAEGGTLFLDEIADLRFDMQTKLLKVVEEGKYNRLGDSKERVCNVRFIFATNRDLGEEIKKKRFREDLYYRISTFIIELKPLRENKEKLKRLIEHYKYLLSGKRINEEGMEVLLNHEWRGNVRELIQVLKRAGVEFDGKEIGGEIEECLWNHINGCGCRKLEGKENNKTNETVEKLIEEIEREGSFWEVVKKPFMKRDISRREVKEVIKYALSKTKNSKYKECLKYLNIEEKDYKKFLDFLKDYKIV